MPQEENFETVFVGYGIEDKALNDYESTKVNGKIVVAFEGEHRLV